MMKKAGQFLKLGFVALAATIFCSSVHAQSNAQGPGRKDESKNSTPVVNTRVANQGPQKEVKNQGVAKKSVNTKQSANAARGYTASLHTGNTTRNCTPKSNLKPYSITRASFNKLSKDRQQFVLANSNKYTIVD